MITELENAAIYTPRRVFFTGSTALRKGYGVCYDRNYATTAKPVTTEAGERDRYVELPSTTNNLWFAGYAAQDYVANAVGQWIDIYKPGAVCEVAVSVDTVIPGTSETLVTVQVGADAGRSGKPVSTVTGFKGRGTAMPLQTKTNILGSDYSATAALDTTGLILTDSGADFVTTGVAVGDKVVIVAGEDDNTDYVIPGVYTVTEVTDLNTLVLDSAASTTGGTMEVSYYVYSGNPTVMCETFDGEESGLIEFVQPTSGSTPCMVGGMSYLHGGTNPGADSTFTVADATREGLRKGFYLLAAFSSNDFLAGVTSGVTMAGGALTSFELDAADEHIMLEWHISAWRSLIAVCTETT